MNVAQQNQYASRFFTSCLDLLNSKGPDYAPDNLALLEVLETAWETDSTVERVLWVYMKKQISAIRRFVRFGALCSETPESRFRDTANYAALLSFWHGHRLEIYAAAIDHVKKQRSCGVSGCAAVFTNPTGWCDQCLFLRWLEEKMQETAASIFPAKSSR